MWALVTVFLVMSATAALLEVLAGLRRGYVRVFSSPIYRDTEPVWFWIVTAFGFAFAFIGASGVLWILAINSN